MFYYQYEREHKNAPSYPPETMQHINKVESFIEKTYDSNLYVYLYMF